MKLQRQLSNGSWREVTDTDKFVGYAVETEQWLAPIQKREPRTAQGILNALAAGEVVKYDEDWYAEIRDADAQRQPKARKPDYPNGRKLDCGHIVYYTGEVMNTSRGSSCANCYDQMSD